MTFEELGLNASICRATHEAGYKEPTPIQREAIPPALKGRDVLGCAQTGTGKTAAFSLPTLQHLDKDVGEFADIRALVVTPTRELAAQIGESFSTYGRYLEELWHTVVTGGVSEKPQIRELRRGVDTLIATPGRLLDLIGQGEIDLKHVEIFVLDEADRMLDMGFLPDVKRITTYLPKKRQTLFFSATFPPPIAQLAESLLHDPVKVAVTPVSKPAERVEHQLYFVDKDNKRNLLLELMNDSAVTRALVFSRTKHGANRITQILERKKIKSAAIHGNKSQGARQRALEGFRRGELRVLVASDLAARGLDVDGVSHVFNFDLPNVAETYVHRIGRTARAGQSGIAISFCDQEERAYLVDIERLIGQHLSRVEDHPFPPKAPLPPLTKLTGERVHGQAANTSSRPSNPKRRHHRGGRRNHSRGAGPRPR